MRSLMTSLILTATFTTATSALAIPNDPSYGTSDPPNYRRKNPSSSQSRYVYPSYFSDPYYGTGNPPGYNERKARELGREYVPPAKAPRWSDPTYGTSDPNPRRGFFRSRSNRR